MKKHILTLLTSLAITASALAHGDIELGPDGGRILQFSKDETMNGEVTIQGDKLQIVLLDKAMKPVVIAEQTLTANAGPTGKAEKLLVETKDGKFLLPLLKDGDWLILQFKADAKAKAVTARLHYDLTKCGACNAPEWICKCAANKEKKK